MTYHDNRDQDLRRDSRHTDPNRVDRTAPNNSIMTWAMGGILVAAVLFGAMWAMSDNDNVASNNRPATTATAPVQNPSAVGETTGAGANSIPQTPPATNR
jgi:hypothetical protein